MANKKSYIYPVSARVEGLAGNPYIDNFVEAFQNQGFSFVNYAAPSKIGIFDIFKYLLKINYVFFHWPESIPDKKMGSLQYILVLIVLYGKKILGLKIFWLLHNKESHVESHAPMKRKLYGHFIRKADFIVAHSTEGLKFLESHNRTKNCYYYPHPCQPMKDLPEAAKDIDLLIWGSVNPYKGTDIFLKYINGKPEYQALNITIAGKISDPEYEGLLKKYATANTTFINKIVDQVELDHLFARSKNIVFTYRQRSVLSSGALMDSISTGIRVLGPHTAAFKDLAQEGLIETYEHFDDLIALLEQDENDQGKRKRKTAEFVKAHSWQNFSEFISLKTEEV
jgi:beta-1,4-mannosyltransferase